MRERKVAGDKVGAEGRGWAKVQIRKETEGDTPAEEC